MVLWCKPWYKPPMVLKYGVSGLEFGVSGKDFATIFDIICLSFLVLAIRTPNIFREN